MKEKALNIGILGCATIAERSVIPAILELNDLYTLEGIASRDLNKAKEFAEKFESRAYLSYEAIVEDINIDAVYIPLPNSLHAEWIEKALQLGKHVLVEKSLACTYNEVKYLNNLAKDKGLTLIENFQFRFHSQLEYILNLIEQGTIGDIRCIRSSFGFPGLPSENDIRYQADLGGGALFDAGAYPVKISQIFMGYDIEVKASNLNFLPEKNVDIWGGAYLKQRNGNLFAEIAFGFQHFYQCNIEIWGSKGKLSTNRIFTATPQIKPVVELETQSGKQIITLNEDKHFNNMLTHFHAVVNNSSDREDEYVQNINQSRLIHEIIQKR